MTVESCHSQQSAVVCDYWKRECSQVVIVETSTSPNWHVVNFARRNSAGIYLGGTVGRIDKTGITVAVALLLVAMRVDEKMRHCNRHPLHLYYLIHYYLWENHEDSSWTPT